MTDVLLTWMCSYLLHSSLLIGVLWLAERVGALRGLATSTQEALWRVALLGGLVSASLPLLPAPVPAEVVRPAVVAAVPVDPAPLHIEAPAAAPPQAQLGALPVATRLAPRAHDLALGFVAVWLLGAVAMLAALAWQWRRLRLSVRRLRPVADPHWQALTARLAASLGVPVPLLRHAPAAWASPLLAPGRVLCLPAWCLDLPDDEARAVLGHELAHLRRRDPAWRLLAAGLRALLWPQLLNRLATRRLDLLAELACDAAAAGPGSQRLALAQSLLRCAEALEGGHHGPALACGAASAGSPLGARVRRLLGADGDEPIERRGLRWGLLAAMVAGLIALPAVVVSHTDSGALLDRLDIGPLTGSGTRVYSRYPGGSFGVRMEGSVAFNEAEDDVQSLTGRLTVKEREGDLTREMRLTSMGGGPMKRDYRVDGESRPMDDAARVWWARAAQRMAESLTDPLVRARKLFARGGLEAVLADVERPLDDHSRRRRIEAALKVDPPLPTAAQDRLIAAAESVQGGFERREALSALARLPLAETQQLTWLKAAATLDGDFERREALGALAPRLVATPAVLAAWTEAVRRIGGDFERRTAIEAQVAAAPQPAVLAAALQAISGMQGDFERREALALVGRRLQGDEAPLVEAYAAAASAISGGFERREALNVLLDRPRLGAAGLERVLASAEGMDAGFERLQVLMRVAEKLGQARPVDAALVERIRRAGRGLSDHERGQIENALDRLG